MEPCLALLILRSFWILQKKREKSIHTHMTYGRAGTLFSFSCEVLKKLDLLTIIANAKRPVDEFEQLGPGPYFHLGSQNEETHRNSTFQWNYQKVPP